MKIHLRRFERADADACSAIVAGAIALMGELDAAARTLIGAHATPELLGAELQRYVALVALHEGCVVGFGALDGDEIKRVYVQPSSQRRGVGRALMRGLEREASHRGIDIVRITAGAGAAEFYARMGYEQVDVGEFTAGPARVRFVTMRKALGASR